MTLTQEHFKVYQVVSPIKTHFRKAESCAEVDCSAYLNGWKTTIDERTELGQSQAYYIRKVSGRGFTEQKTESGLTEFLFEPGQNCFKLDFHRVRLDKPQLYRERTGRGPVIPVEYNQWQEDFAFHQEKLKKERG